MSNPFFTFKRFTVYHDKCAMKVGTDGVLLGAWVDTKGSGKIIDVGSGTGLIAIMVAQRSEAHIDAVEIEADAYKQATGNVEACPWNDRIEVYNYSFQYFASIINTRYDLVVSNPPYFRNSLKPSADNRSLARHDERLGYESLLRSSKFILAPQGRLAIIIPAKETERFTDLAYLEDLYPLRLTWVRPNPLKDYSRCLMEFARNKNQACSINEILIKHVDSESYTEDYIALTREYYLRFEV